MSDLKASLKLGKTIKVVFIKKDGTERTMIGTTNMERIPKVDHPKTERASSPGIQRIYDLEIGEWRSVTLATVQKWEETIYEEV